MLSSADLFIFFKQVFLNKANNVLIYTLVQVY